ncbi:MAG TPA: 2-octaprenyl-6-methoxyphenyl hydroxylase [Steroidobacteraceae bacterium]|jgi:2-octaprenyl-6-methoxyphenol hydroxylase|nr:2-octaprenyl-6-methoxyphenyl hydroxylase [Steroidobacteraceae bacterium]
MNAPSLDRYDVAIVGGGMVGASLALALAGTQRRVLLIEAVAADSSQQPSFDDRTTALGNGARRILQTLGVWADIEPRATPITQIHVSDAGRFGFARLRASEHELHAFGCTVSNRHIGAALWRALQNQQRIEIRSPARVGQVSLDSESASLTVQAASGTASTVQARLVVAADGAHSMVKQAAGIASDNVSYDQLAVVANVRTDRRACGIAYERFTDSGPLAVLPLYDGAYTVVWTLGPQIAEAMRQCGADEFCRELQNGFGWRAGRFMQVGQRGSYPLALVTAQASVGKRVALIGNAAQALHPVAAQGFNLGLRDAAVLAELIVSAEDPGADSVLAQFAARRSADRAGMIAFTDRLVKLFSSRRPGAAALRDLGLLLFDINPIAKQALSRISWGFGGALPRLSRGLPL